LNTANNTYTLTTPVCTQPPDLCITKTVDLNPPCVSSNVLMTYTLTVSSLNSVATTGVLVKDTIPANTTFVSASNGGTFAAGVVTFPTLSLPGNSSVTRTVTLRAANPIPGGVTSFVNVCTVTDDGTHGQDSNTANNSFTLTTPICSSNTPEISLSSIAPCIAPGDNVTYSANLHSPNATPVTGVVVTATIPNNTTFVSASNGGTFDSTTGIVTYIIGTLAGNATVPLSLVVKADAIIPANVTTISNSATVTFDGANGPASITVP